METFGNSLIDQIERTQTKSERIQQRPWNRWHEERCRDQSEKKSKNKRTYDGHSICKRCNRPYPAKINYKKKRDVLKVSDDDSCAFMFTFAYIREVPRQLELVKGRQKRLL